MDIRPIKTEADYEWAIAEISEYFEHEPEVGSPDGDRFDVLATLIEAYEDQHHPMPALDPIEAIAAHVKLFDLPRRKLVEVIGSPSRTSEVMHRRRALTVGMIHRLNRELNIPAEVLVQPYRLRKPSKVAPENLQIKRNPAA